MAARLTPFGSFFKWVLVPAALAGSGYFFFGPRLGRAAPGGIQQALGAAKRSGAAVAPAVASKGAADIEVSVKRVTPDIGNYRAPRVVDDAPIQPSTAPKKKRRKAKRRPRRRVQTQVPPAAAVPETGPAAVPIEP